MRPGGEGGGVLVTLPSARLTAPAADKTSVTVIADVTGATILCQVSSQSECSMHNRRDTTTRIPMTDNSKLSTAAGHRTRAASIMYT